MIAAVLLASLLAAESPRGYVCARTSEPIVVDGRLEDAGWKDVPWTDDFADIEGAGKPRPQFRTRAKMAWDDRFFYIAAELEEPHVWANLTEHDAVIFRDNDFEVFLDPDGDNHNYFEIEINARNTEWDLLLVKPYRDGGPAVNAWEIPGLKTAVHVDGTINDPADADRGWSVEMAIPWSALADRAGCPCPPRDGDVWRGNFSRVEWATTHDAKAYTKVPGKPESNWVWSPQGVIEMHRPERWGTIRFSSRVPGAVAVEADPDLAVRNQLMRIYEAQRAHRDRSGAWAGAIGALGLAPGDAGGAEVCLTAEGYEATIAVEAEGGRPKKVWTIRQDSRISHRP